MKRKKSRNKITGRLDISVRGVGVVVCDNVDRKIHLDKIGKFLHDDLVDVYVFTRKRRGKYIGEITRLLHRDKTEYVGQIQISSNFSFVVIDNKRIHVDVFVPLNKIKNSINLDKVVVEIQEWNKNSDSPNGIIKKVLGKQGDHNTEIHSILADHGLPIDFEKDVLEFANNIDTSIKKEEIKKRRDFRKTLTFTIDPTDAKDFDDAISVKYIDKNKHQIGIHIADVSHYLIKDTILDREAYQRGTSVYLVDRVVPMLPEILSNKACSLRPNEDKYTFSAVFTFQENKIVDQWFGKTVINSDYRFSYKEAQEVIEKETITISKYSSLTNKEYKIEENVKEAILLLNRLASSMRRKE